MHTFFAVKLFAAAAALGLSLAPATNSQGNVETWGQRIGPSPVSISGLPSATDVQASNWGGLAVDSSGNVWQWDQAAHPSAIEESGPSGVSSIGEGYWFSAAVDSAGKVWTWGDNNSGDLCNGSVGGTTTTPAKTSVTDAVTVTGGAHRLAILLANGRILSCGSNQFGQLGNRKMGGESATPVYAHIRHVVELSGGDTTDVALRNDGTVWDWGQGNLGELGDGRSVNSDTPVQVILPGPATEAYAGGDLNQNGSEIALLANGTVWAWGDDAAGQLGPNGDGNDNSTPVQVPFSDSVDITWVGEGGMTGYALDSDGNLWAWGDDTKNEYGDSGAASSVPQITVTGCSSVSVVANKVVGICSQ